MALQLFKTILKNDQIFYRSFSDVVGLDDECQCRVVEKNLSLHANSTCGILSTSRGPHQKVISFTFYLSNDPKEDPKNLCYITSSKNDYFDGIKLNLEFIRKLYPGYVMRVYHNAPLHTRFVLLFFRIQVYKIKEQKS